MLSFMGQQDKAEQITDVMMYVMNFIKPFQKYISPFGVVGVIANSGVLNGDASGMGSFFNEMIDNAVDQLGDSINYMLHMVFGDDGMFSLFGLSELSIDLDLPELSFNALKNFAQASGIYNGEIKLLIDIACSIDTAELANWIVDGLLVAFSLISLYGFFGGLATFSSTIAIIAEVASLALTITAMAINSVALSIGAFFFDVGKCIYRCMC